VRFQTGLSILIVWLLGSSSLCHAQSPERVSLELDFDVRTRIAAVGASRTALYNGAFRFRAGLAPGLHAEVYGAHQDGGFLAQQATLEKDWGAQRLQLGLVRIPFGIYDHRETYASGLIDYPLLRGDYGYYSLDWGVPGAQWAGGNARFQVEAAGFGGKASGVWSNQSNVGGGALRVQTYARDLILGASRWDGYMDIRSSKPVHINGLDLRYTRPHLLLRGEYLFGDLGGNQMHGWYLDVYYHLPKYEKLTLVARIEQFRPEADEPLSKQITLGVRYVADSNWTFAVNWRRNNAASSYAYSWTPYAGRGGDIFLQVYRKLRF
jgi:hypothetical protein